MEKSENIQKNIGIEAGTVKGTCTDDKCPFHGMLKVRGRIFSGTIASAKMRKTATLHLERREYVRKYQRYEKKLTKLKVHNPDCMAAKEGDNVTVAECRPLSKTKKFVIIKKG